MTVVTLNPSGTQSSTGIAVTGAADAHTALSDNSDSSYVAFDAYADRLALDVDDITLPAGAVITQVAVQARAKRTPGATIEVELFDDFRGSTAVPSASFATFVVFTDTTNDWTAALINNGDPVRVNTDDDGGGFQLSKLEVLVTYVAKPVTAVTAPSGAVSNTNAPAVTWTNTLDSAGGAQTKYEVKIFSAAQYGAVGFDPDTSTPTESSGVVAASSATWSPADPLPDDTYRAYVRVAQTVFAAGHWSAWDYEGFTVTANSPGVPSLTVTPQHDEGRILLTLDDTLGAETDAFEIQRSIDGGATWETIRTLDSGLIFPTGGVGNAYDNEVGNGVDVVYRARALNIITEFTTYGAWTAPSSPTAWESSSWWLKSAYRPEFNIPVEVDGIDSLEQDANQGIFYPLGRRYPIVVSDVRSAFRSSVAFVFDDALERAQFDDLLDLLEPLLLQAPARDSWEDRFIMLGNLSRARGNDKSWSDWTRETLPWVEVDTPAGDVLEWPIGS